MRRFREFLRKASVTERTLNGPAFFESGCDRSAMQPEFSAPFRFGHRDSQERELSGNTSVILVLHSGSPAAIFWRVISIIVDSVDLMFGCGSFAHVLNKCFDGMQPTFANRDASTSVVPVCPLLRIRTTILHAAPNPELGSVG